MDFSLRCLVSGIAARQFISSIRDPAALAEPRLRVLKIVIFYCFIYCRSSPADLLVGESSHDVPCNNG